ncbi:acetyl-CoA carboxylase biotin carboxyl carrier protein [Paenibacillus cymbidii]|uniref:acetyl-CoA carboxylase biotin carboxyl carrier protein n=1 Tax=Paenibacillus cymbidii TaxID=1639034 RepID=UPI001081E394|nr:acetyl-CoA carboxylase biotin carboxyl carrier protein [Paenibacillus cymbidii]
MFKLSEIKDLVKLVDQSSLQELEIQNEGYRLSIRKPSKTESVIVSSVPNIQQSYMPAIPQQAVQAIAETDTPAAKPIDDAKLHKIVSPMVGTFYQAPSPDAPPFVSVGDKIHEKSVVCIIEAMKLMNDIPAEVKGEVVDILVENGQLVDYGQTLFLVKMD